MIKWKVVFVAVGSVVVAFTVFLQMVVSGLIEREHVNWVKNGGPDRQIAKQAAVDHAKQAEQARFDKWMRSPERLAMLKARALQVPSCMENMEALVSKHPLWSAQKGSEWVAMDWDEDKCTMGGKLKSEREFGSK